MFKCIFTGIIIRHEDTKYTTDLFYDEDNEQFGVNTLVKLPEEYKGKINAEMSYIDSESNIPYELGVRQFHYCQIKGFTKFGLEYIGRWTNMNSKVFRLL